MLWLFLLVCSASRLSESPPSESTSKAKRAVAISSITGPESLKLHFVPKQLLQNKSTTAEELFIWSKEHGLCHKKPISVSNSWLKLECVSSGYLHDASVWVLCGPQETGGERVGERRRTWKEERCIRDTFVLSYKSLGFQSDFWDSDYKQPSCFLQETLKKETKQKMQMW